MRISLSLVICFSLLTACTKITPKGGGDILSDADQQAKFERAVTGVQEEHRLESVETPDIVPDSPE